MPFTPATLRSYVDANIEDNASQQVTPADVRNSFKVAADVMDTVYPDGSAAASAVAAAASAASASGSASSATASASAAAASAASVDGSLLLSKSGNLAGLTSVPAAVGNLGLTNRVNRPGALAMWPKNTPPAGALERDGSPISRTTYADLFAVIGTDFGAGNGTTTFNLPDDRGISERGWDHGRGFDSGRAFGSYQADSIQNHTHTGTTDTEPGHSHTAFGQILNGTGGSAGFSLVAAGGSSVRSNTGTSANSSHSHSVTTGNPSVGGAVETRGKNRAYLPIIYY